MEPLEGGDISIEHFLQDQRDLSSSNLQEAFQDSSCVLLTGATGLVGSLVLEKLLRCCSGVTRVLVPVRGKDGKAAPQRFKELFSSKLFDRLKLDDRDALNKVELLDLDLGLDYFSTSVASAVTMVIHCALLTDGDHPMRKCVDTNIKFTMALMHFAYSCTNLEAFVVVSSTLCHNHERVVEERFYPPPVTAKAMVLICDTLSEEVYSNHTTGLNSEVLRRLIVRDTSAAVVTLSVAEDLIRQSRKSLPIAIVRPSMLVACYKEPLAGWMPQEPRGLMKLLTLTMQGRLCSLRSDPALKAELMPADLAANLVLAVTGYTALARRNWLNQEIDEDVDSSPNQITSTYDIPIYNLVSSNQSPISWKEFFVCSLRHAMSVPFLATAWYPHLLLTKSRFWFSLWFYLVHLLPAKVIDWWITSTENPNILNAKRSTIARKSQALRDSCDVLTYHSMSSQKYRDHNTQTLWRLLSPRDRLTFNFAPSQLDWDEYLYTLARGVRLYCLGDSLDTLPRASKRLKKLKLLHCATVVMTMFVFLILLRVLMKFLLF